MAPPRQGDPVVVRIPTDLLARLDRIAADEDVTRSVALRQAVDEFVVRRDRKVVEGVNLYDDPPNDPEYSRARCGLLMHVDDLPTHGTNADPCDECDEIRARRREGAPASR